MDLFEALEACEPGPGGLRVAVTYPGRVKLALQWSDNFAPVMVDLADENSKGQSLPGGAYEVLTEEPSVNFNWRPAVVMGSEEHD